MLDIISFSKLLLHLKREIEDYTRLRLVGTTAQRHHPTR